MPQDKPESLTTHVHRVARAQKLLLESEPKSLEQLRALRMVCGCYRDGTAICLDHSIRDAVSR